MVHDNGPSNIRQGRFLRLSEEAKDEYLENLRRKIAEGYFFKDSTLDRVAEELGPIFWESTGSEM